MKVKYTQAIDIDGVGTFIKKDEWKQFTEWRSLDEKRTITTVDTDKYDFIGSMFGEFLSEDNKTLKIILADKDTANILKEIK